MGGRWSVRIILTAAEIITTELQCGIINCEQMLPHPTREEATAPIAPLVQRYRLLQTLRQSTHENTRAQIFAREKSRARENVETRIRALPRHLLHQPVDVRR
jgi:hypothetical protein